MLSAQTTEERDRRARQPDNKPGFREQLVRAIKQLAASAMEGAPAWLKTVILIVVGVAVLAGLFGMGFFRAGKAHYAFWALILSLGLLFLCLLVMVLLVAEPVFRWTRLVPAQPIPKPIMDDLSALLEEIRMQALGYLRDKHPGVGLDEDRIRANVFLPDYERAHAGDACSLHIPENLRINMTHPPEWHIRFRPGEGLTGRVFAEQKPNTAHRLPGDEGGWPEEFRLTAEQERIIHKSLKWIVSFPLKDPSTQDTLAVLNIDGLTHDFDDDTLGSLMEEALAGNVSAFVVRLAELKKVRISVRVDSAGDA